MKRILRITSHAGHSRYLREMPDEAIGWIPKQTGIPSPYRYSATHLVYRDPTRGPVIIVETAHKRYDVFAVPPETRIFETDEEAQDAYMAARGALA